MQMSGLDPTSCEEIFRIQLPTVLPVRANTLVGARHLSWMVWDSLLGEKDLQGEKGSTQAPNQPHMRLLSLSMGDGAQPTQGTSSRVGTTWQ